MAPGTYQTIHLISTPNDILNMLSEFVLINKGAASPLIDWEALKAYPYLEGL